MPNGPSRNALVNTADVYPYVPAQDADAGNDPANCYPAALATGVACSAQPEGGRRDPGDGRPTSVNTWLVVFGPAAVAWGVGLNWKFVLHVNGRTHTVYADGDADGAGRGYYCGVNCTERA